jgi:transketolase C-terminal domain/subunit
LFWTLIYRINQTVDFAKVFPARFFNMELRAKPDRLFGRVGCCGKNSFCRTFAFLPRRAFEQIRNSGLPAVNVRLPQLMPD